MRLPPSRRQPTVRSTSSPSLDPDQRRHRLDVVVPARRRGRRRRTAATSAGTPGRPACRRSAGSSAAPSSGDDHAARRALLLHDGDESVGQHRCGGRAGRCRHDEELHDARLTSSGLFEVEEVAEPSTISTREFSGEDRAAPPRRTSTPMQPSSAPWRYSVGWGGTSLRRPPATARARGRRSRRRAWPGSSRARRPGWPGRAATSFT